MVHCKIALAGSLRRFSVADGPTDGTRAPPLTLPALRRAVARLAAPARAPPPALAFVDDEGDACALRTDADLREALAVSPALLCLVAGGAAAGKGGGGGGGPGARGAQAAPVPLLRRVEDRAVGGAYRAALALFLEAAARGGEGAAAGAQSAGKEVCALVRKFMLDQGAGRGGDAGMGSAIPETAVDELCGRVDTHLRDSRVSEVCRERLVAVVREAMSDAGVRAGLAEIVSAPRAKSAPAVVQAEQTPLQCLVRSATTPRARVALNKARRAVRESSGARALLIGVRPAIRKASMSFVREHCLKAKAPGAPLKTASAPSEFGADVRSIVAEAGADAAVVDAAEQFAVAMASDPGARLAGARMLRKLRQRRVAKKAENAGSGADDEADASVPDANVDMAAAAIATASIEDN